MSANSKQIGGSHYAASLQHWDVVEKNGIGYLEGCATKYISRWRKKNGLQDLEKGLHYTEKLIELAEAGKRRPRGEVSRDEIQRFIIANDLELVDGLIVSALFRWNEVADLEKAVVWFGQLIGEVKAKLERADASEEA